MPRSEHAGPGKRLRRGGGSSRPPAPVHLPAEAKVTVDTPAGAPGSVGRPAQDLLQVLEPRGFDGWTPPKVSPEVAERRTRRPGAEFAVLQVLGDGTLLGGGGAARRQLAGEADASGVAGDPPVDTGGPGRGSDAPRRPATGTG